MGSELECSYCKISGLFVLLFTSVLSLWRIYWALRGFDAENNIQIILRNAII